MKILNHSFHRKTISGNKQLLDYSYVIVVLHHSIIDYVFQGHENHVDILPVVELLFNKKNKMLFSINHSSIPIRSNTESCFPALTTVDSCDLDDGESNVS